MITLDSDSGPGLHRWWFLVSQLAFYMVWVWC